ncbi:MAG: DNA methyltransferase, partial [Chloroherpetonaceae bacterium]
MELDVKGIEKQLTEKREVLRHHNIILYQGDSTNPRLFDEPFIDLIVTSPPYNVGIEYNSNHDELNYDDYLAFSRQWLANCFAWSKSQARLAMNIPLDKNKGGAKSVGSDLTRIAQEVGWKYQFTIVW